MGECRYHEVAVRRDAADGGEPLGIEPATVVEISAVGARVPEHEHRPGEQGYRYDQGAQEPPAGLRCRGNSGGRGSTHSSAARRLR